MKNSLPGPVLPHPRAYSFVWKMLWIFALCFPLIQKSSSAEDLLTSDFERSTQIDNPWLGVTGTSLLKVCPGQQLVVNDEGDIKLADLGPSVAVGDLNGDGLPDLVIADAHGFIWYFPNSGTPAQFKFTNGEIMPVWFGFSWGTPDYLGEGGADNIVSKIQLVKLSETGNLLDLLVGNYAGRLFCIHNTGGTDHPVFRMPQDLHDLIIPTHKKGVLWCNYLSPFFYNWYGGLGRETFDLIVGDGTYSANSIYLFKNQGSKEQPIFNEDAMTKIIPGMGREDLTPQVIDWNNDGKPDIICGERTGRINLFLNTGSDPNSPTFDAGQYVKLGAKDNFGGMTTVTVCDLVGNKLPNLIVTNSANQILYAQNTGTPGSPQFAEPVPIQGANPPLPILQPIAWTLKSPHGVPYELLVCTNSNIQKDFTAPPNTPFRSALRYFVYPFHNLVFPETYYPKDDTNEPHVISCTNGFKLRVNTSYDISFWIRTTGAIRDLSYQVRGWSFLSGTTRTITPAEEVTMGSPVNGGRSWTHFTDSIRYKLTQTDVKDAFTGFGFSLSFRAQGELYLDGVSIRTQERGM